MKFEIKSRWSGSVLFVRETDSLKLAVEAAVHTGADLMGADLMGADLMGADLRGAVLTPIRDDIWAVLSSAPAEVADLRQAILEGRIDGSSYEGSCACLVGTLANARHCKYDAIPGLTPNSVRPAERFFAAIKPGDTPPRRSFRRWRWSGWTNGSPTCGRRLRTQNPVRPSMGASSSSSRPRRGVTGWRGR